MYKELTVEISPPVVSNITSATNNSSKSNGYLLGLYNDKTKCLEITNSFPLVPQWNEPNSNKLALEMRVKEMLSYFRTMNVDYDIVGFYTLTSRKDFLDERFIGSLFEYQKCNENFIGLVHDTSCGCDISSSLRAFKLKSNLLNYFNKLENLEMSDLEFGSTVFESSDILDEISISIKSMPFSQICCNMVSTQSKLVNSKESEFAKQKSYQINPLKNTGIIIDEVNSRINRQNARVKQYVQQVGLRENFVDRRNNENNRRLQRGDPMLPINDDLNTIFGPLPVPTRIENVISLFGLKKQSQIIKETSGISKELKIEERISESS